MVKKITFLGMAIFLLLCKGFAQLTLDYYFNAVEGGYICSASDGNHFYLGRWFSDEIAKHNMDGSDPVIFSIPGVSELRDLTYDGVYFYGVNETKSILKLDLANQTLVGTIPVNVSAVSGLRHISYDPTLDGGLGGFWVGGFYNLFAIRMNGSQITIPISTGVNAVYGSGYDPYSDPDNPCLWLMTQPEDQEAFMAVIRKYDINSFSLTSFWHDCANDNSGCANEVGGAMHTYAKDGKFYLAGNVQSIPNTVLVYELADLTPSTAPAPVTDLAVSPSFGGALGAMITWTNPGTTHSGATLTELTAVKVYQGDPQFDVNAPPVYTATNPTIGGMGMYMASVPAPGYYAFKVVPENSTGTGSPNISTPKWLGHDMPAAPENPVFTVDDTGASWEVSLSWTAPSTGLHGGFFTAENLVYDVIRMPGTITVAENQTELTFAETITQDGTYSYNIIAKNHIGTGGSVTSSEQLLCRLVTAFPWTESFSNYDFPPVCWTNYHIQGATTWQRSISNYHTPPMAAVHYYIEGIQESWLVSNELAVPASGNMFLDFWTKITSYTNTYGSSEVWLSTQSNDPASGTFVKVKELQGSITEWQQIFIPLHDYLGENLYIAFHYVGNYAHIWYIDDVSIKDVPGVDAAAKKVYGAAAPMAGQPFLFKAVIENVGTLPLADYTVKLTDGNNNVLALNSSVPVLNQGEKALINLYWTPTTAGDIALYATVDVEEDNNLSNNKSTAFEVAIQPESELFECSVGTDDTYASGVPFEFMVPYCAAQSIYYNHEILGRGGFIKQLQFFNDFWYDEFFPVQIWLANTNKDKLEEWLPKSEFTLIFEGEMAFPAGKNAITVELQQPFEYKGDNLVMMTKPMEMVYPTQGLKTFQYSTTPDFSARSRVYVNQVNEFDWSHPGSPINYFGNIKMEIVFDVNKIEKHDIADLQLYPNPTTGELRIKNYELKIKSIEILDVYGRKLLEEKENLTVLWSYDLTVFPAGIYFVIIESNGGEKTVRKMVKQY